MISLLAIVGWLVAFGLACLYVRISARLERTQAEMRGAEYRAAAAWNAWEEAKHHRSRPVRSAQLEGSDSFSTVDDLTRIRR